MQTRQKHSPLKCLNKRTFKVIRHTRYIQIGWILIWAILHTVSAPAADAVQKSPINFENPFKKCWEFNVKNETVNHTASDNNNSLYFSTFDGKLNSLNAKSGLLNWQSQIGGKIVSVPAFGDGRIYVLAKTVRDGVSKEAAHTILTVHSLDKTTGITRWQTIIGVNSEKSENDEKVENENFYLKAVERNLFIITGKGSIINLDVSEGGIIQTTAAKWNLSTPPFFNGNDVIFGTVEKRIVSIRKNDPTGNAELKISEPPTFIIVRQNGGLVWGDRRGFVVAADVLGDIDWKFRSGGKISGLLKTPNGLMIVSDDNYIYLLSENGKIVWKKRLAERLFFMPLIVGNYAAVALEGSSEVALIDLKSGRTINKIIFENETRLNESPLNFGELIVLNTSEGFLAYTTESCSP